jgi:hypothetical protein
MGFQILDFRIIEVRATIVRFKITIQGIVLPSAAVAARGIDGSLVQQLPPPLRSAS